MKIQTSLTLVAAACALAACAPSLTGPVQGRIVNTKTGQEGSVSFERGTLKPRLAGAFAADNATISIGQTTYRGRTVLIDSSSAVSRVPSFDFGVFGSSGTGWNDAGWNSSGWGTRFGTSHGEPVITRSGNLIAKTAGDNPQILTCTLSADSSEHGVGECTGSDGSRYALQF